MTPSPPKISKTNNVVKIGTHNGTFHCDEVLACFMLKLLPEYRDAEIVRTRSEDLLAGCDIVVDVGAKFDAEAKRFDHHQKSFKESMHSLNADYKWTTKLSSAGLVYYHYGKRVIKTLVSNFTEDENVISLIYEKVYAKFVEEVDAVDNGINQSDGDNRYAVTTTLSNRVSGCNAAWNAENVDEWKGFQKATAMVGKEFTDKVQYYASVWLPARKIVEEAFSQRAEVDVSKKILKIKQQCPWKEHLYMIEQENNLREDDKILYVLYGDQSGNWRVQCVPKSAGSFENRKSIKKEWQGIRDKELSSLSGIDDCIFVHASGFIGGNKTFSGALEMAKQSVNASS